MEELDTKALALRPFGRLVHRVAQAATERYGFGMRHLALAIGLVVASCQAANATNESTAGLPDAGSGGGQSGSDFRCMDCLSSADCNGDPCIQIGSATACASVCPTEGCATGSGCASYPSAQGEQVSVCVPTDTTCGGSQPPPDSGPPPTDAGACGALVPPTTSACCQSCTQGSGNCQPNGCYGGWWCNVDTCLCHAAPTGDCNPPDAGGTDAVHTGAPPTGTVTASGGTVSRLYFAVVGDTRPKLANDNSHYPTAVITKEYLDLEQLSPRPEFAVATGDFVYADTNTSNAAAQMTTYMTARAGYSGTAFFTLGNHECTGYTDSNCGSGNADGVTANYQAFRDLMLSTIGQTRPYYAINLSATDSSWTAKVVVIAANAWSSTQASWLTTTLSAPTTYTFVVRHEPSTADTAPGVGPSQTIIQAHPVTLVLEGHTHTYSHHYGSREVIMGLGGAPASGGYDYGYLVLSQAPSGNIVVSEYDYQSGAVGDTFVVGPDGSPQ